MKIISWNVNGIRAAMKKGFDDFLREQTPDILLLQEVKAEQDQVDLSCFGDEYEIYWNPAQKKGYSGVAAFSKKETLSVEAGIGIEEHDQEGRVLTLEFPEFFLTTVYTPNSQNELRRLPYRQRWDADFLARMVELDKKKPVIFAGDLNVAHQEIDLARPKSNRKNAGFSDEERAGFDQILSAGFVDSFRHFFPEKEEEYSWWSYRAGARKRNVGWRIDYFCVSEKLTKRLKSASILQEVLGSDHCPVQIELD